MFFIHTFSMIKVFKKREEVEQLWKIYNQKNITEKKVFRINEFSDKGVRLVIRDSNFAYYLTKISRIFEF